MGCPPLLLHASEVTFSRSRRARKGSPRRIWPIHVFLATARPDDSARSSRAGTDSGGIEVALEAQCGRHVLGICGGPTPGVAIESRRRVKSLSALEKRLAEDVHDKGTPHL